MADKSSMIPSLGENLSITSFISLLYGIYQDQRNWREMSPAKKEELEFEDEIADENADDAFRRQREFQMEFLTPEAQLKSTAAGFDAIGLNRMMMAGSSPGASSASAPQASSGSASGNPLPSGIFSPILEALKIKQDGKLEERRLDIQDKQADAVVSYYKSLETGQNIENEYKPSLLSGQVDETRATIDRIKEMTRSEVVSRNLMRSGIKANEARAALDRANAFLSGINARIAQSDANTRAQFDSLQNAYMYWAVETARAQTPYVRRLAEKQLGLMSAQIALLSEQKYGTMVGYMNQYESYKQNKFTTSHQNAQWWVDNITGVLKTAGITIGSVYGLGKLIGPGAAAASTLAMPRPGYFDPSAPLPSPGAFMQGLNQGSNFIRQ